MHISKNEKCFQGLFIWDETPHLGGTSHLSEVRFIPRLYEKNIHLSKTLFIPVSLHVYLLIYYFCFKFELLISIHTARTNCTFWCNNYKNTSSLNYKWTILPRWDSLSKTVYMRKIIPPKWDLTSVDGRSQLGGMNLFSCKRFAFTKWNTPFC